MGACTPSSERTNVADPGQSDRRSATTDTPLAPLDVAPATFELGVDLVGALRRDGAWASRNVVVSPYSLSSAFGMVYAGARGDTAREIASTFHYGPGDARLHAAFARLRAELTVVGASVGDAERGPVELRVANALWAQEGFGIVDAYREVVEASYGGDVTNVDFARAPDKAREHVNGWVNDRTRGLVPALFPRGAFGSSTKLVLVNTVYLRGAWEEAFPRHATRPEPFETLDGRRIQAATMRRVLHAGYVEAPDYQAAQLRYAGGRFSFFVILPARGKFAQVEESLTAAQLEKLADRLSRDPRAVNFAMPKLQLALPFSLGGQLAKLGVKRAFTPSADFSGMASGALFLDQVHHHIRLTVDEEQTEAAAATGIVTTYGSAAEQVAMQLDRPFLVGIQDIRTGVLLFWGRVVDPSAGDGG